MPTFEQAFCQRHHCDKWKFRRAVFWRCVPPHAKPVALLMGGFHARFFEADRELISGAAIATSSRQLSEETRDFIEHPANRHWMRRHLRIRVSTGRLRRLARGYVDEPPAPEITLASPRGPASARIARQGL